MTIKDVLKRLFFTFTNRQSEKCKCKHGEIRQVSIKDIHEAKKSLEEAGGIEFRSNLKSKSVTEEKYRHDIIASLHEGIDIFKDNELRKASVESFAKSKMAIEEIKTHLDQVRSMQHVQHGTTATKLPQKSIPEKRKDSDFII